MVYEDPSPEISLPLRKKYLEVPKNIQYATGIRIHGKLIRSIIFTTDVVSIRNNDADAVMAVYPFTPQPVITQAITVVADKPVMMGVGGGTTQGKKVVNLALHAEFQGALAVVLNAPVNNETIREVSATIDIPIIITTLNSDIRPRLENGAHIVNVSASIHTPQVVQEIRREFPNLPIIATGGPTEESVMKTIQSGANAITYTPPTVADMMKDMMHNYRGR